ncbi:COP9 signalosome complex subunit 7a, partial [Tolypocladium capitatum]
HATTVRRGFGRFIAQSSSRTSHLKSHAPRTPPAGQLRASVPAALPPSPSRARFSLIRCYAAHSHHFSLVSLRARVARQASSAVGQAAASASTMEQTMALDAIEPFLALSKSATAPRAAADLITRATSAPNTYLFAELLQTPQVQALAGSPDYASHLALLQIFSYGTYQTYRAAPGLPPLSDAQSLKLRQLSLLTLARDRSSLSYDALREALGLESARQLEDLVVRAVYAGLLHATLDPARQAVQVTSISPLRDIHPGSIPDMITALNTWSDRCTSTLGDLEARIKSIRSAAAVRAREKRTANDKLRKMMAELREPDQRMDMQGRDGLPRRGLNKRSMLQTGDLAGDETMEVDEPILAEEQMKRVSKRKI